MKETFRLLFAHHIRQLKKEIELYKEEGALWRTEKNIANSGGNLCLHLLGNLNTYIGAVLGGTPYERKRDLEFSLKHVPRAELLAKLDETLQVVDHGLSQLTDQQLQEDFPVVIWEKATGTVYTLSYLLAHLGYHLGQINYHRRLLDNE
jgi:hypothetical protein